MAFFLCLLSLLLSLQSHAAEATSEAAIDYFNNQYYEEAAPLLLQIHQSDSKPHITRLLGHTYYYLLQFEQAEPLLTGHVRQQPDDIDSRLILTELFLEQKKYKQAERQLSYLTRNAKDRPMTWVLNGRLHVSREETELAIRNYKYAYSLDPSSTESFSSELLSLYIENVQEQKAVQFARTIIANSSSSFERAEIKAKLDEMGDVAGQEQDEKRPYSIQLGYLLESDDYLLVATDDVPHSQGVERESDTRNVLNARIKGKYALDEQKELYGEAIIYQSLHNNRDEYDQLRQNYLAGIHMPQDGYGFRIPYSYAHFTLDHDFYYKYQALTPEAYLRLSTTSTLHGLIKFQLDDYRDDVSEEENRDGSKTSFNLMYHHYFDRNRGQGGYMMTVQQNDSDGANWKSEEYIASGYLTYYFSRRMAGRFDLRYGQQDYDNLHSVYSVVRDDSYLSSSLSFSYWYDKHWEFKLTGLWIDRDSNIPLYDYTRKVYGLGVNWHY